MFTLFFLFQQQCCFAHPSQTHVNRQAFAVSWRSIRRVVKREFRATVEHLHHIQPRDEKLWHEMEHRMRPQQSVLLEPSLRPKEHDVAEALRALGVHDSHGTEIEPDHPKRSTKGLFMKKAKFVKRMAALPGSIDAGENDDDEEDEGHQSPMLSDKEFDEEVFFMMPGTAEDIAAHQKLVAAQTKAHEAKLAEKRSDWSKSRVRRAQKRDEDRRKAHLATGKKPPVSRTVTIHMVRSIEIVFVLLPQLVVYNDNSILVILSFG